MQEFLQQENGILVLAGIWPPRGLATGLFDSGI
jgi:hypothetical protein